MWIVANKTHEQKAFSTYGSYETEEKARSAMERILSNPANAQYTWGLFTLVETAERASVPVTWTKVKVCEQK